MNVLFISPTGTLDNGAEISILNLMKYLSDEGLNVYNVFPLNENESQNKYVDIMLKHGIKGHPISTIQWWWEEAPTTGKIRSDLVTFSYQHAISVIRQIIRNEKIDLVISNTVNVFQGAIAAACENIRHIYIIHEFPYGEFAYYKDKIKFIDQHSDAIYAVTGELFKELRNYFPKEKLKEFVPYSPIGYYEKISSEKFRIISVGKISERKNQLELIKAYRRLNRKDIPLVFIGDWDTDYKHKCDLYIEKYELDNIHFLGYKDNPWKMVTEKDICVLTSKLETFGLVYVESLLNGIPTIVSNNPGHLSVYSIFQNGTIYSTGDLDGLSNSINQILNHFDFYKNQADDLAKFGREYYHIHNVYKTLISDIKSSSLPIKKVINDIKSVFDFSISNNDFIRKLQNQVSIYIATTEQSFSENTKTTYSLKQEDKIEFYLDSKVSELRVDLSESPSIFSSVKLLILEKNIYLNPLRTNGIQMQEGFIFLENDPYIVYDVSEFEGVNICIEYRSVMSGSETSNEGIFLLNSIKLKLESVEVLEKSLNDKKNELELLRTEYQNVLTSRRWILSTKIINFFRRK
ncbi:glycosyltransferase family 4 protein [Streptococcus suis]